MRKLSWRKRKSLPPENPLNNLAETIKVMEVKTCPEHKYLMRYVRLTFYLIVFEIMYTIIQGGMPITLIAAVTKLIRFIG